MNFDEDDGSSRAILTRILEEVVALHEHNKLPLADELERAKKKLGIAIQALCALSSSAYVAKKPFPGYGLDWTQSVADRALKAIGKL